MINFRYLFHPSSCGYFCLKYIIGRVKEKRKGYLSLFELKEILIKYNYCCYCFRVKKIENIKNNCITLINVKNSFHYIVIRKIDKKFVYFYDPLFLFVRKVKKISFVKKWSRICLFYVKI